MLKSVDVSDVEKRGEKGSFRAPPHLQKTACSDVSEPGATNHLKF